MQLKIISAGAGSGKTYRLTQEMVGLLKGTVRPEGIIATTFTKKAAAELQERVRVHLLKAGMAEEAEALGSAMIGTVHSLGVKLLQRFAYEAGVSPQVAIVAEEDHQTIFNLSLATVLSEDRVIRMEQYWELFGMDASDGFDWRDEVRRLTEIARSNGFDEQVLRDSARRSFEAFREFLDEPDPATEHLSQNGLYDTISDVLERLATNGDATRGTAEVAGKLKHIQRELKLRHRLPWRYWAQMEKLDPSMRSREAVEPVKELARRHLCFPRFHEDLRGFLQELFDLVAAAIQEYSDYKKKRGLIDYTDMEVLVNHLLDRSDVCKVLQQELDLLMVDEFQDTSPIQLEIFLKLSRLAKYSVWVGDPKQSIYGFRGAAPELMYAIIRETGGIRKEDIQSDSWRSREDLVGAVNALFCRAFPDMEPDQVVLNAKRLKAGEPEGMRHALHLWKFDLDAEEKKINSRPPGKPWTEHCIAFALRELLNSGLKVLPKGESAPRKVQPGDVAILCRTNTDCAVIAEALHTAGLDVSISRSGLMQTAEARLILSCLKYLLHHQDTLSVAEILLLAENLPVEAMIEDRLAYLEEQQNAALGRGRWGERYAMLRELHHLRPKVAELSCAETLDLLLGELDLRRIIAGWGNTDQRLDNVEIFRKLAVQFEDSCNRLQAASSLGGFLLWLNRLEGQGKDFQSSGQSQGSVNVLTYHKSKGLEWPVVICYNLDTRMRSDIWGVEIHSDAPEVDLDNLLGNRHLRYWINPYGNQSAKTTLAGRISEHPSRAKQIQRALEEERRLLYVGLTRARDYLIFPVGVQPTRWLNRTWHEGQDDVPTLDPHIPESPWSWNGHLIPLESKSWTYTRTFVPVETTEPSIRFIEPPAGRVQHPGLWLHPRQEKSNLWLRADAQECYGVSPFQTEINKEISANVAGAYLLALQPDCAESEMGEIASNLIGNYDVQDFMEPGHLMEFGKSWMQFIGTRFPGSQEYRKYPLRYNEGGRIFEADVDILLQLPEGGMAIVQHTAIVGPVEELAAKATEHYGAWAYYCRQALLKTPGAGEIRVFIHFVMQSIVVELV